MSGNEPYKIDPPFYVSFSGGRTSGYLLRHVLDAWGGTMPDGGYVLFANTGKEHEATLEFVREIERNWCPVTWLEWRDAQPTQTFQVVSFDTASRNGEPFEALIRRRKLLPNPVARFCTGELKVNTMQRYLRSLGHKIADVSVALGLRADEPRRVSRVRADTNTNIEMPMASMGVTRQMVEQWWSRQSFDLRLPNNDNAFGNCDLCFLKSQDRIHRVMLAEQDRVKWWSDMEKSVGQRFRQDRAEYAVQLTQVTAQGRLFADMQDDTMPCQCTD